MSEQAAWLAGFYEGEGNIHSKIRFSPYQRILWWSLAQKDESQFSLLRAKEILTDIGIQDKYIRLEYLKSGKCWYLRLHHYESIEIVCKAMWDWLSPRRKGQIQEAFLVYCEDFIPSKKSPKEVYSELCEASLGDSFPRLRAAK